MIWSFPFHLYLSFLLFKAPKTTHPSVSRLRRQTATFPHKGRLWGLARVSRETYEICIKSGKNERIWAKIERFLRKNGKTRNNTLDYQQYAYRRVSCIELPLKPLKLPVLNCFTWNMRFCEKAYLFNAVAVVPSGYTVKNPKMSESASVASFRHGVKPRLSSANRFFTPPHPSLRTV